MKNTKYFLASVLSFIAVIGLRAVGISDYYSIDNISMPKGLDSQVGGLDFMPDGRLVACFHRGEVSLIPRELPFDLSTDVQNQVRIVSNSEHPFIHEPKQFSAWRTHSTN